MSGTRGLQFDKADTSVHAQVWKQSSRESPQGEHRRHLTPSKGIKTKVVSLNSLEARAQA
jgi:hypothetical protein